MPTGGGEQKSTQVAASGGTRGVDPERDAKGGSNPKPVPVKVDGRGLAAFKKEGGLAASAEPYVVTLVTHDLLD